MPGAAVNEGAHMRSLLPEDRWPRKKQDLKRLLLSFSRDLQLDQIDLQVQAADCIGLDEICTGMAVCRQVQINLSLLQLSSFTKSCGFLLRVVHC